MGTERIPRSNNDWVFRHMCSINLESFPGFFCVDPVLLMAGSGSVFFSLGGIRFILRCESGSDFLKVGYVFFGSDPVFVRIGSLSCFFLRVESGSGFSFGSPPVSVFWGSNLDPVFSWGSDLDLVFLEFRIRFFTRVGSSFLKGWNWILFLLRGRFWIRFFSSQGSDLYTTNQVFQTKKGEINNGLTKKVLLSQSLIYEYVLWIKSWRMITLLEFYRKEF